jgi:hypothetical protein
LIIEVSEKYLNLIDKYEEKVHKYKIYGEILKNNS